MNPYGHRRTSMMLGEARSAAHVRSANRSPLTLSLETPLAPQHERPELPLDVIVGRLDALMLDEGPKRHQLAVAKPARRARTFAATLVVDGAQQTAISIVDHDRFAASVPQSG
jgi:hypothetical protein